MQPENDPPAESFAPVGRLSFPPMVRRDALTWELSSLFGLAVRGAIFRPRADGKPVGLASLWVNGVRCFDTVEPDGIPSDRLADLLRAMPTIYVRPGDELRLVTWRATDDARALLEVV